MPSIPPAGLTPASAFDIVVQTEQVAPPAILADLIDPKTGEYLSLLQSATIADGMVIAALRVQRGSGAAVREFGQDYRSLTHVDEQSPELVESLTREALQPARDAGVVLLKTAIAQTNATDPSQVDHVIEYVDLLAPPNAAARRLTFTE